MTMLSSELRARLAAAESVIRRMYAGELASIRTREWIRNQPYTITIGEHVEERTEVKVSLMTDAEVEAIQQARAGTDE